MLSILSVLASLLLAVGVLTASNPVIFQDYPDVEVVRDGSTFYMSCSSFALSPGAPVLESFDLVNWQQIGHSVPVLNFTANSNNANFSLPSNGNAYVQGIFASSMKKRPATGTWYWVGCIDYQATYIYTATTPAGPWTQTKIFPGTCFYDVGLLFDDNDNMYVAYGNTNIYVTQIDPNSLTITGSEMVYNSTADINAAVEGSRMYQVNGVYYILVTQPPFSEYTLKSSNNAFGPYKSAPLVLNTIPPVSGGGNPHQGGIVDTPNGQWYYMAFQDAYPLGRMPVLAPMYFNATGWPTMNFTGALTGGQWPTTIASPVTNPAGSVNPGVTGTDSFSGTSLNPQWEWNHNPDTTKFTVNNGLTLKTASVSSTLYQARNTLTRRTLGPKSNATIQLQFGSMANGDIAGFALFRDYSATIAVHKTNNAYTLVQTNGIASDLNSHYFQTSAGTVEASMPLSATSIYLRATADVSPADSHIGSFSYSYDGQTFTNFGSPFTFNTTYYYFLGYRFGIFNYATSALGGSVSVPTFNLVNA